MAAQRKTNIMVQISLPRINTSTRNMVDALEILKLMHGIGIK